MTHVSVIIPAYNEGAIFTSTLVKIAEHFALYRTSGYECSYLIVNDGSTDETAEAAEAFAHWRSNVRIITHATNRGLGAALRTAFAAVEGDFAVVLDADLSYSPHVGMELLEALEREDADVATASPYMRGGTVRNVPAVRRFLSREANRILSLSVNARLATLTCMVRAYRIEALKRVCWTSDGMDASAEILFDALRKDMRVVEIPAALHWSNERRESPTRMRLRTTLGQIVRTFGLAFSHRPAFWLAIPGLFPGLLPLVVAALLILRVSPRELAWGTAITVVVQYTSLAIFAGQLGAFFTRTFHKSRHQHQGVQPNGYHVPKRTA